MSKNIQVRGKPDVDDSSTPLLNTAGSGASSTSNSGTDPQSYDQRLDRHDISIGIIIPVGFRAMKGRGLFVMTCRAIIGRLMLRYCIPLSSPSLEPVPWPWAMTFLLYLYLCESLVVHGGFSSDACFRYAADSIDLSFDIGTHSLSPLGLLLFDQMFYYYIEY